MPKNMFYQNGLRFSCTRCSRCCREEPGYVFLSVTDVRKILEKISIPYDYFLEVYCRWIPSSEGDRLSLREKNNYDCIFWEKGGCALYEVRPFQCRSFPFWVSCLSSVEDWNRHAADCPGMNTGALHDCAEIDSWLAERRAQEFITRRTAPL